MMSDDYSFDSYLHNTPSATAAARFAGPPQYAPLRFARSMDFMPGYDYADNRPPSADHDENLHPMDTSMGERNPGQKSKKRRPEEQQPATNDKRARTSGLSSGSRANLPTPYNHPRNGNTPRGTQHDPVEIKSSPEPEASSSARILNSARGAQLYIEEPSDPQGKVKWYYAVAGGKESGIYTNYTNVEKTIKGYPNVQKKFRTQQEAFGFLETHQDLVQQSLDRQNAQRTGPMQRTPLSPPPSYTQSPPERFTNRSRTPENFTALELQQPREQHSPAANVYQPAIQTSASGELEPILSDEQQRVVDLIVQGHNVFYTGSAGCGKSTILRAFVKQLRAQGKRIRILAPTNLAALQVGGQTIWNYAGWTPGSMKDPLEKLEEKAHGVRIWKRFHETDVLVIDEISMVENHVFERLNAIMTASRGHRHGGGPFGGVQLIVTGDFCQLSPVKPFKFCITCDKELKEYTRQGQTRHACENPACRETSFLNIDKWAFRSRAWTECNFKHINLTQIHRQSDRKFISILQRIRTDGVILKPHAHVLLNHKSETEGAVRLFSRRADVERLNEENMARLPSQPITYQCSDTWNWKSHHRDDDSLKGYGNEGVSGSLSKLEGHRYEIFVRLKHDMRILLLANIDPDNGLVNGSQGLIIGFEPYDRSKLPQKKEEKIDSMMSSKPTVKGAHALYAEHEIKHFAQKNNQQPWPIVRFDNGLTRTVYADCTASEFGVGEPFSLLSRTQVPLQAGYAITIHKSQGMTLERVIVNLARAFEPQQAYVALSRAKSLLGLKVEGLPKEDLGGANEQVKQFFAENFNK